MIKIEKLSIIMPAFNEERHIYQNILATAKIFDKSGLDYEIIIANDGSTDRTVEEAEKAKSILSNIKIVHSLKNQGKGWALREGFKHAVGNYIVFLDSDLDLHPQQIHLLFEIMEKENADIVIGSKRHPDSVVNYPIDRIIISSGYFFLIKLMFGLPIRDTQTGLKLFKSEVLKNVFPRILVKRFAFDLEVLAVAYYYGYKIAEAPVVVHHHMHFGLIGIRPIWDTWWETMAIFYRMKILKYYDRSDI